MDGQGLYPAYATARPVIETIMTFLQLAPTIGEFKFRLSRRRFMLNTIAVEGSGAMRR
jgi:hypothetical protein